MSLLELNSWSGDDHAPRVLAKFWKIVLIGQRNIALEVSINKSNKSALFWNLGILMHVMGWHALQEQIKCLSSSGNMLAVSKLIFRSVFFFFSSNKIMFRFKIVSWQHRHWNGRLQSRASCNEANVFLWSSMDAYHLLLADGLYWAKKIYLFIYLF